MGGQLQCVLGLGFRVSWLLSLKGPESSTLVACHPESNERLGLALKRCLHDLREGHRLGFRVWLGSSNIFHIIEVDRDCMGSLESPGRPPQQGSRSAVKERHDFKRKSLLG